MSFYVWVNLPSEATRCVYLARRSHGHWPARMQTSPWREYAMAFATLAEAEAAISERGWANNTAIVSGAVTA